MLVQDCCWNLTILTVEVKVLYLTSIAYVLLSNQKGNYCYAHKYYIIVIFLMLLTELKRKILVFEDNKFYLCENNEFAVTRLYGPRLWPFLYLSGSHLGWLCQAPPGTCGSVWRNFGCELWRMLLESRGQRSWPCYPFCNAQDSAPPHTPWSSSEAETPPSGLALCLAIIQLVRNSVQNAGLRRAWRKVFLPLGLLISGKLFYPFVFDDSFLAHMWLTITQRKVIPECSM